MKPTFLRCRLLAPALLLAAVVLPAPSFAQAPSDWNADRTYVTRADLQALLASFDEAARSAAYSEDLRSRARSEAGLVRSRLEEGDFRIGDQITLIVRDEAELSTTFTVQTGPVLVLPGMGEMALRGVLRSELVTAVTDHLDRYIRDPKVRATSTIRITVAGEVGQPGFYAIESGTLLTDVLGVAGGPNQNADLKRIRVERGAQRIWDGDALNDAIIEGRTLDELSMRAGDRIVVPAESQTSFATWALRIIGPGLVLSLIRQLL